MNACFPSLRFVSLLNERYQDIRCRFYSPYPIDVRSVILATYSSLTTFSHAKHICLPKNFFIACYCRKAGILEWLNISTRMLIPQKCAWQNGKTRITCNQNVTCNFIEIFCSYEYYHFLMIAIITIPKYMF